jgi:predicted DNA-binding transcriptional regulator AlpA
MTIQLRFAELKTRGIVRNWVTLRDWVERRGFPPGRLTGPNTRTWTNTEIEEWLSSRPTAPKPVAPRSVRSREDTAVLRALADGLGIKVDGRWGSARLQREIDRRSPGNSANRHPDSDQIAT